MHTYSTSGRYFVSCHCGLPLVFDSLFVFFFSFNIEIQTGDWRGQRSSSYIYRNQWRHSFFKFMVLLRVFTSRPIFHSLGSSLVVFNFCPPNIHPTCYGPLDFIICGTTFHLSDQTPPNMSPSITLFFL